MRRSRCAVAFTIVEILTVFAIIFVLAAILIPVCGHVREAGRRTTCANNLRQIAMAIHQYVQENDGIYPSANQWGDAVMPYLKSKDVFICPDHLHNPVPMDNQDYNFDWRRLNGFSKVLRGPHGRADAILTNPATVWMNADSYYHVDDSMPPDIRLVNTPCGRDFTGSILHDGSGNYSFVDGHVQWLTPEAMGVIDCQSGPPPAPFHGMDGVVGGQ